MRWMVILVVLAAVCWASVSTSAPCRNYALKYGLDCSPAAQPYAAEPSVQTGCTLPFTLGCEL